MSYKVKWNLTYKGKCSVEIVGELVDRLFEQIEYEKVKWLRIEEKKKRREAMRQAKWPLFMDKEKEYSIELNGKEEKIYQTAYGKQEPSKG